MLRQYVELLQKPDLPVPEPVGRVEQIDQRPVVAVRKPALLYRLFNLHAAKIRKNNYCYNKFLCCGFLTIY
jgi:hypothetical protein